MQPKKNLKVSSNIIIIIMQWNILDLIQTNAISVARETDNIFGVELCDLGQTPNYPASKHQLYRVGNEEFLVGTIGGFMGELWMIFCSVIVHFPDFDKFESVNTDYEVYMI